MSRSRRNYSDIAFKIIAQWYTIIVESNFSLCLRAIHIAYRYGRGLFVVAYCIIQQTVLRAAHHGKY
jgi:hypothetical protein